MTEPTSPITPEAAPKKAARQKVPPFARYKGTSAWVKDRRRAREYARYRASQTSKTAAAPAP